MFKDVSYLELLWTHCSIDWKHLCNFGRGPNENIYLKLFEIWISGSGCHFLFCSELLWLFCSTK